MQRAITKSHKTAPTQTRMAETEKPATMTMEELGRMLGLGRSSLYIGISNGEIPAIRVGKRIVIARAAIEEWLRTAGARSSVPQASRP